MDRIVKLAPFSYRTKKWPPFEPWSWIYFHMKAEDHCQAWQDEHTPDDWQAPDLIKADVPIEAVPDGRMLFNFEFIDGTPLCATIWTVDAEYRRVYPVNNLVMTYRRIGLVTLLDDEEGREHAIAKYDKRYQHL